MDRALLRGLPNTAVLLYDLDLRYTLVEGAILERHGFGPGHVEGRRAPDVIPPEHWEGLEPNYVAPLHGEVRDLEYQQGAILYSLRFSPLRDEGGEVVGGMLIVEDVTERRRGQQALREAEERFRRAFDDAPIGMALVGLDGTYLQVNQALSEITGYSAAELEGTTFESITLAEDLWSEVAQVRRVITGEVDGYKLEKRYLRADGEPVWVRVSVSLVRDSDGTPRYFVSQVEDVSEAKRSEDRLRFLADHDALTGLFNRRRFEQELSEEVVRVKHGEPPGSVLVLDLDHFKYVSDTLGHAVGNEVLRNAAALISDRTPRGAVVGRLGGDEFAVLLPGTAVYEARHFAEALAEAVRRRPMQTEHSLHATVSIGVAPVEGDCTADEVLVHADLAMYEAKDEGRDRVTVHEPTSPHKQRVSGGLLWSQRIRKALDRDLFVLHAQPIVDLATGVQEQYELLIRMRGEDGTLAYPGDFLQAAERFGLIRSLDRWVVSRAIELIAEQEARGAAVRLEVNLSGTSLDDPDLPGFIEGELRRSAIDPSLLIFEVTETAAIEHMERAQALAERLGALGCGFALDDFGTGFGSFYYVKSLPFDYLKIDGEFISGLAANRTDQLVVQAVVDIARGLGKKTIAEFVADEETVRYVRETGVDYAQGYHLGRPVPLDEALAIPA